MRTKYIGLFGAGIFFLIQGVFILPAKAAENTSSSGQTVELKINGTSYNLSESEFDQWLETRSVLTYNPDYLTEIENIDLCHYQKSLLCDLLFYSNQKEHIQKITQVTVNQELVGKFLDDLARQINRDPEDATFKIENGKVSTFSLSEKGLELDKEKSLEILTAYLENPLRPETALELPYTEIAPNLSIDSIDSMGIDSLIGEGRSNFRGSPQNRIHNIKVASNRFNGILIRPGEEFSFVKILGDVDGEHGYLPELVIKKDKTEPEFGGGICQVSTTAFRAALYSGLEITARRNHAYPVSYYNPQGMDATVYVPRPDLRFKNNTPSYILIQTKIEGTELIFDFYGTDDGRKTEIDGPKILERNADGSMKTTFTQIVTDKDGNVIIKDVFNSSYDSPSKYPHPGTTSDVLSEKPKSWSDNEWSKYKKEHGI